jgi:cytidylate kinase
VKRGRRRLVVAIDGPVGAGKSSAARALARRLGYRYVDTGAMYRAVGWRALREAIPLRDGARLAALARRMPLRFAGRGRALRILLGREDVTRALRSPAAAEASSRVSTHPGVRRALVAAQRAMGGRGGVVMEGRDIGTVVFPRADVKFYLDASPGERAWRRWQELRRQGARVSRPGVQRDVIRRDRRDRRRSTSPLRAARDAIRVDTTGMSLRAVVDLLTEQVQARRLRPSGR